MLLRFYHRVRLPAAVRACVVVSVSALALSACSRFSTEPREAWRGEAEKQCLRSGQVKITQAISPWPKAIAGVGPCGMDHPLKVSAVENGQTRMSTPVAMACPMVSALDRWVEQVVQPAAVQNFGQPVVEVETAGTYNCRRVLNRKSGRWSEHSFGNAIDISGFKLADGRRVRVGKALAPLLVPASALAPLHIPSQKQMGTTPDGWLDLMSIGPGIDGAPPPQINFGADARPFWQSVRDGACGAFTTVLGPGSEDGQHEDHLHLDLARHGKNGTRRVCR